MDSLRKSKAAGIVIITCIYIVAACIGVWVYMLLPFKFWLKLLIADCIATVFVFFFSCVFNNASVYDPYWSVQPIVIAGVFALFYNVTSAAVLLLISIVYWGVRLTFNWAYCFGGLNHQDWRYTMLREKTGKISRFVQDRTGSHFHVHAHLIGDYVRKGCLSETRRPEKQCMVQTLSPHLGSLYEYLQILHHFLLAGKILEFLRPHQRLHFPVGSGFDFPRIECFFCHG